MKKSGKVKYADPVKGYGYILAEDAKSPSDTTFFRLDDTDDDIDVLVAGDDVEFEVEAKPKAKTKANASRATQVKRAAPSSS
jgi:cold shock CspA family protein